jgi:uncharacterized protein (TIGR02594 family)
MGLFDWLFKKKKQANYWGSVAGAVRDIETISPVKLAPSPSYDISPWLTWLIKNTGQKEIPGKKHNKWIVNLFEYTSYKTNEDETPWCAACINAALEAGAGLKGTRSAAAKSFMKLGEKVSLQPGAIVVISRAPGRYHVTCCDHIIDSKFFAGRGGNQGNELNCKPFEIAKIVACRWLFFLCLCFANFANAGARCLEGRGGFKAKSQTRLG